MKKIVTGPVRLSFPHVIDPEVKEDGSKRYSAKILIPKDDTKTLNIIQAAIKEEREDYCDKHGANALPPKPKVAFYDGDTLKDDGSERLPEEKGHWTLQVGTKHKPQLLGPDNQPLLDENEIYAGCWVRVSANACGYQVPGNKGITFYLNAVKKVRDDTPFSGGGNAASDFADDEDDLLS